MLRSNKQLENPNVPYNLQYNALSHKPEQRSTHVVKKMLLSLAKCPHVAAGVCHFHLLVPRCPLSFSTCEAPQLLTAHVNPRNRNDIPSKPHALPSQQLPPLESRLLRPLVVTSASTVVAASLRKTHARSVFLCDVDVSATSVKAPASTQNVEKSEVRPTKLDRR